MVWQVGLVGHTNSSYYIQVKTKNFGSSALDICYIAAGRIEGCVFGTLSTRDISAALGILEEAGGLAVSESGLPLAIAKNPQKAYLVNNQGIARALQDLLES